MVALAMGRMQYPRAAGLRRAVGRRRLDRQARAFSFRKAILQPPRFEALFTLT